MMNDCKIVVKLNQQYFSNSYHIISQASMYEERVKTTSTVYESTKHLVYEKVITE